MPTVFSKPLKTITLNESIALINRINQVHLASQEAFETGHHVLAAQQCRQAIANMIDFDATLDPAHAAVFDDTKRQQAVNYATLARCLLVLHLDSTEIPHLIAQSLKTDPFSLAAYHASFDYYVAKRISSNVDKLKTLLTNGLYAHGHIELQQYSARSLYTLHDKTHIRLSTKELHELFKFANPNDVALMINYGSFLFDQKRPRQKIADLYKRLLTICNDDEQKATLLYNLGNLYFFWEKNQDLEYSRDCFEQASALGQPMAQFSLACMYDKDDRSATDKARAIELYQAAAAQQHLGAIHNLGFKYYYGEDCPQDIETGLELFKQVESVWNELQQPANFIDTIRRVYEELANHYYRLHDLKTAEHYLELAREQQSRNSLSLLGDIYFKQGRYRESLSAMHAAIEKYPDSTITLYNLSLMYEHGQGIEAPDLAQASEYLMQAISKGSSHALFYAIKYYPASTKPRLLEVIEQSIQDADEEYESLLLIAKEILAPTQQPSSEPLSAETTFVEAESTSVAESTAIPDLRTAIESIYADNDFPAASRINRLLSLTKDQPLSNDDLATMINLIGKLFNATLAPHQSLKVKALSHLNQLIRQRKNAFNSWQLCSIFFGLKQLLVSPDDALLNPIIESLSEQLLMQLHQSNRQLTCNHRIYLLNAITRLLPCQHPKLHQALNLLLQQTIARIDSIRGNPMFVLIHQLAVIHHYQKEAVDIRAIAPLIQHCIDAIEENNNIKSLSQAMLAFSYFHHCLADQRISPERLAALQAQVATLQTQPTESSLQRRLTECCRQIDPNLKTEVVINGLPVDIQLQSVNNIIVQVNGPSHYLALGIDCVTVSYLPSCHDAFKTRIIQQPNNTVIELAFFAEPHDARARNKWIREAIASVNSHSNPQRMAKQPQAGKHAADRDNGSSATIGINNP